MPELLKEYAKEVSLSEDEGLVLKINDYILYYRVTVLKKGVDGKENYVGEFLTAFLRGLTDNDLKKLEENNELTILYGK